MYSIFRGSYPMILLVKSQPWTHLCLIFSKIRRNIQISDTKKCYRGQKNLAAGGWGSKLWLDVPLPFILNSAAPVFRLNKQSCTYLNSRVQLLFQLQSARMKSFSVFIFGFWVSLVTIDYILNLNLNLTDYRVWNSYCDLTNFKLWHF